MLSPRLDDADRSGTAKKERNALSRHNGASDGDSKAMSDTASRDDYSDHGPKERQGIEADDHVGGSLDVRAGGECVSASA